MQFKIYSTVAIVLCIGFVQICQSVDDQTMKEYLEFYGFLDTNTYLNGNETSKDLGPEFVEDIQLILEKFDNNPYVTRNTLYLMYILVDNFHGNVSKITSTTVKEGISQINIKARCWTIDRIEIIKSLLLKELPRERISGVINLYSTLYGGGTDEDLENSLEYLYGTAARPTDFYPNILSKTGMDCEDDNKWLYGDQLDVIRSIVGARINPKIRDDMSIIAEKFPNFIEVNFYLKPFVTEMLKELDKKYTKYDICELRNQYRWFTKFDLTAQAVIYNAIDLEIILPTRVPEENFKDLLNLVLASYKIDGSDWEKAVKYVFSSSEVYENHFDVELCKNITTMERYMAYYKLSDLNTYLDGDDAIKDISPTFIEDVQMIREKFNNNTYVIAIVSDLLNALADKFDGRKSKITFSDVKEELSDMNSVECWTVNVRDTLRSLLLKQLPSERADRLINLMAVIDGDGTGKDLGNALGYLYGIETHTLTANQHIPLVSLQYCSGETSMKLLTTMQDLIDEITSMNSTKLNPKISNDVWVIADNFSYDLKVFRLLTYMKELLIELDKKNSTKDILDLKNQYPWFQTEDTVQQITFKLIDLELILSTRLQEECYMDVLNLIGASYSIEGSDLGKALDYAYSRPDYFNVKCCDQKNITANTNPTLFSIWTMLIFLITNFVHL